MWNLTRRQTRPLQGRIARSTLPLEFYFSCCFCFVQKQPQLYLKFFRILYICLKWNRICLTLLYEWTESRWTARPTGQRSLYNNDKRRDHVEKMEVDQSPRFRQPTNCRTDRNVQKIGRGSQTVGTKRLIIFLWMLNKKLTLKNSNIWLMKKPLRCFK